MDYSATLDSFAGSFQCSASRDNVLVPAGGWGYVESMDSSDPMNHSDLLTRVNPEQIYQRCAVFMECRRDASEFAGMTNSRSNTISRIQMGEQYLYDDEVTVGLLQDQQSHLEEHLFPRTCDHNTSLKNPPSLLIPNLGRTTKQAATAAACLPSVGTDEATIMRAMMAVISSSNSSSSAASSPSAISNPPPQEALTSPVANSSSPWRAFRPYSSTTPNLEPRETSTRCGGQKMIKDSVEMLRRMRSWKGEESSSRSTNNNNNNQLHHMISERRRREKLNDSFHRLRMILPPGSKDKASVLISARNHLRTLRAQIAELEEKNRRLETHLLTDEAGEGGSVRVQVMKAAAYGVLQQIHITITVRVECDIVDLLLHVLECLRALRVVGIGSVDAVTYSPQMPAFARANLKLQIRSCDWDEVLLQEAVTKAIIDVTAIPESIYFQFD